jgi:outer membrane protein with beta-barrel domain
MRFKAFCTTAALLFVSGIGFDMAKAQVAPAAIGGGRPIGISVGVSDYNLDYGTGRRMQGLVLRGGVGIFHGLGIDGNARTIFMNTPSQLTRMQQNTFLGGVYYESPSFWRVRPFVRFGAGLGTIEFPSRNPAYTRDSYTVFAPSGGLEFPITRKVYLRGEWEYQFWRQYQGPNYLTPQGGTVGVTYYLSGMRSRPHRLN